MVKTLKRSNIFVKVKYAYNTNEINIGDYDVVLIKELSFKNFTIKDCNNVTSYVAKGGILISSFRGWVWRSYG
jgi:hypothetical protein